MKIKTWMNNTCYFLLGLAAVVGTVDFFMTSSRINNNPLLQEYSKNSIKRQKIENKLESISLEKYFNNPKKKENVDSMRKELGKLKSIPSSSKDYLDKVATEKYPVYFQVLELEKKLSELGDLHFNPEKCLYFFGNQEKIQRYELIQEKITQLKSNPDYENQKIGYNKTFSIEDKKRLDYDLLSSFSVPLFLLWTGGKIAKKKLCNKEK